MDKINYDDLEKTRYAEKNMPHPDGPRSHRRRASKKRCKRLREVRNKLLCGGEVICANMRRHGKKVRKLLQTGCIDPSVIARASGVVK